jgi:hypothetical protein
MNVDSLDLKGAMTTQSLRSKSLLMTACVLAVVLGRPTSARAADWIGWLEGFSGPGPSSGFEFSFEFACLDITERVVVNRTDIVKVLPPEATGQARVNIGAQAALQGFVVANGEVLPVPATARLGFSAVGVGAGRSAVRSCFKARSVNVEAQRQADRSNNALLLKGLTQRDTQLSPGSPDNYVLSRHDWQTGIVFGIGRYESVRNVLFDGKVTGEVPQLRFVPMELLAHSKLSPAVDIGAGVGVGWFHTEDSTGKQYGSDRLAVYLVPLSVVVRPVALFIPSQSWATAIGYRVAMRRFGALDGTYFGANAGAFSQPGEIVWGHSLYVDLLTLLHK